MANTPIMHKAERIVFPRGNPSETTPTPTPNPIYEQPLLQVATAIDFEGECTSQEDCDGYEWENICSRDIKVFSPGTPIGEVSDYLHALKLSNEHKMEILENLFN